MPRQLTKKSCVSLLAFCCALAMSLSVIAQDASPFTILAPLHEREINSLLALSDSQKSKAEKLAIISSQREDTELSLRELVKDPSVDMRSQQMQNAFEMNEIYVSLSELKLNSMGNMDAESCVEAKAMYRSVLNDSKGALVRITKDKVVAILKDLCKQ